MYISHGSMMNQGWSLQDTYEMRNKMYKVICAGCGQIYKVKTIRVEPGYCAIVRKKVGMYKYEQ